MAVLILEMTRRSRAQTTSNRPTPKIVLCVCDSILLRNANANMNLLQQLVSLVLNAGHASKQVYY